jgi:hypothetical protein
MAYPSVEIPAIGTQCKTNTGTPASTFIYATSTAYSPSVTMYISGNDPLGNPHT